MIPALKRWMYPKSSAWNALLAFTVITCVTQIISLHSFLEAGHYPSQVVIRTVHFGFAFAVLISLFAFRKFWTSRNCISVFFILFLPYFYFNWQTQMDFIESGKRWVPFMPFKAHLILLSFLVPGPYWINLCLMLAICIQNILFWFYVDLPNIPNVVLMAEPQMSLIYVVMAFTLFAFRYRDQKLIEKLSRQKSRNEVHKKMARIFLSMRDRTNTPLQSQKLSLALLKRHSPDLMKYIQPLENSVETLSSINSILGRLEMHFPVYKENLMTDQEILDYLDKIERDGKSHDNFTK